MLWQGFFDSDGMQNPAKLITTNINCSSSIEEDANVVRDSNSETIYFRSCIGDGRSLASWRSYPWHTTRLVHEIVTDGGRQENDLHFVDSGSQF